MDALLIGTGTDTFLVNVGCRLLLRDSGTATATRGGGSASLAQMRVLERAQLEAIRQDDERLIDLLRRQGVRIEIE